MSKKIHTTGLHVETSLHEEDEHSRPHRNVKDSHRDVKDTCHDVEDSRRGFENPSRDVEDSHYNIKGRRV